ncbi:hypothetical protein [uncultured Pediococcus sp.]|uniref:hypothetical protein n=1 Tax=uncultured Pediococcus sp. TaxID=165192 RepID=UPI00259B6DC4|nr:hypothetical protein [uncultured Pediococcus sp.]
MIGITYLKTNDMKSFKACDVNKAITVDRLIYATVIECSEENKEKLQRIADNNKNIGLKFRLKSLEKSTVLFETV